MCLPYACAMMAAGRGSLRVSGQGLLLAGRGRLAGGLGGHVVDAVCLV